MATSLDNELKCAICLELFQDPRSLPCLHTFCRECIQRSLNKENHSLKCPVCRAKHELDEGVGLLPVNRYAVQELPLKKLRVQQQQETNGGQCKSCEEKAPLVAWCQDCDAMICQLCVRMHKKMVSLRGHSVVQEEKIDSIASFEKRALCLFHAGQELKYVCACLQLVCPECLLGAHKGHEYVIVSKARSRLVTKMQELAGIVVEKKSEFSEYLEKANKAEGKALEYSELMKSKVNNVFDGIVASVEAQRNEALQSVSQGVKEIWSQKEMMEVSLAQLDSFTRFADHTHKCITDASYVAMATQGIKLMERLRDIRGDEQALVHKMLSIGCSDAPLHVSLDKVFALGHPSVKFSPDPRTEVDEEGYDLTIHVSLMMEGFPVIYSYENYQANVIAKYRNATIPSQVIVDRSQNLSWEIVVELSDVYDQISDQWEIKVECEILADTKSNLATTCTMIARGVATYTVLFGM